MVFIPSPRTSSNLNSIELTSLALESLKRVWEVSGGSLESLWEVSKRSLGSFWEVFGEVSYGEGPPERFWEVLDSKSDATLSENAKILRKLVTLQCVFKGQNHFVLQITMNSRGRALRRAP